MERKPRVGSRMAADREVVELPLEPADVAQAWRGDYESATMAARTRPLRVLIVDDNNDLAYSMSMLIQKCGHEFQVAYDGPTALEMAAGLHPDVAFVDIAMPEVDGLCVARELRRSGNFHDCLLIAVTGYADAEQHALGMQAGFDHYMVKPVAFRTLAELLHLARNRLVRSVKAEDEAPEAIDGRIRHERSAANQTKQVSAVRPEGASAVSASGE